jgi:hypothetical protein
VISPTASLAKSLIAATSIVALGVLLALVTIMVMSDSPVRLVALLGVIALLLPTLMVKEKKAYWLFLLVLSMSIGLNARTTRWLADVGTLFHDYGPPARESLSLDLYLADIFLIAMLVPWLARLMLKRAKFFFPKIGYLFILYLAWALIISLIEARSVYLAAFEWCREVLFFLSFVYLINNVVTRAHFRAVALALVVGLTLHSAIIIGFFQLGIGTETNVFAALYSTPGLVTGKKSLALPQTQTGEGASRARSTGVFSHPAEAAYYLGYTLPVVFGLIVASVRVRARVLAGAIVASGCLALYLTFSRSGLLAFLVGVVAFFLIGRWSALISRRIFTWSAWVFALAAVVSIPVIVKGLDTRPKALSARLELIEMTLAIYQERPLMLILGVGLSNSTAVMRDDWGQKNRLYRNLNLHTYYLVVLTEVGIIGFLLFFTFVGQIGMIALRSAREADPEMKPLLVGITVGLVSWAAQNLGDHFGYHVAGAVFWLYAGLIVAIARQALPRPKP